MTEDKMNFNFPLCRHLVSGCLPMLRSGSNANLVGGESTTMSQFSQNIT